METLETFNSVLGATKIKSPALVDSLIYHFVFGAPASSAYSAYGVDQQGFFRGVKAMNKAYRKIESDVIDNITKDKA